MPARLGQSIKSINQNCVGIALGKFGVRQFPLNDIRDLLKIAVCSVRNIWESCFISVVYLRETSKYFSISVVYLRETSKYFWDIEMACYT